MHGDNHSVASSRSNLSGSTRGKLASTFFSQTFPLFPFLLGLQSDYPPLLVHLGTALQMLQLLGFALSTSLTHGESLAGLSPLIYATHLPLWDRTFVPSITYTQYIGMFYACATICIGVFGTAVWWIASGSPVQRTSTTFAIWRAVLHSMSTWLFIPLLHGLLSNMFCGQRGTEHQLWSLGEACYTSATTAGVVVGAFSVVALFALVLPVITSVYTIDPESRHPLARAGTDADFFLFMWKFLLCIVFHAAMSQERPSWVAMFVFCTASLAAVVYSFLLPFYSQRTNQRHVACFAVVSLAGLVSFFTSEGGERGLRSTSAFSSMDMDAVLFFCLLPPVWWFGEWLSGVRINRDLIAALPHLIDAASPPPSKMHIVYPHRLPVTDLAYPAHREICAELGDQAADDPDSAGDPLVLTPFITTIWIPSDVEAACRFLGVYYRLVHHWPSSQMLLLAARIFTKGLTKFWDSSRVIVALSNYAFNYAGKASLGLQQLERVQRVETSFNIRYVAFKLSADLKAELNLRDTSYQKVCDVAKKLHKETLVHMHTFWAKLVAGQADTAQLALLATIITKRRQEGKAEFLRALAFQNNDRGLLTKYASFLEQVMVEPELADQLRIYTKQEAEDRKRTGMRNRNKRESQRGNIDEVIRSESRAVRTVRSRAHTVVVGLFALLFALSGALFTVILINDAQRRSASEGVYFSGKARALASEGALLALQHLGNRSSSNGREDQARLRAVETVSRDLLASHNRVTRGKNRPRTAAHRRFFRENIMLVDRFTSLTESYLHQTNMWGLGFDVVQLLQGTSTLLTLSEAERSAALANLARGFNSWLSIAFNRSTSAAVDSFVEVNEQSVLAVAITYAVAVLTLCVAAGITALGTTQVLSFKLSILALFPIIPRETLQKLCQQAKERVESYDAQEDDVADGKLTGDTKEESLSLGDGTLGDGSLLHGATLGDDTSGGARTRRDESNEDEDGEEALQQKLLHGWDGSDRRRAKRNSAVDETQEQDSAAANSSVSTARGASISARVVGGFVGAVVLALSGIVLCVLLLIDINTSSDTLLELSTRHSALYEQQRDVEEMHDALSHIATSQRHRDGELFRAAEHRAITKRESLGQSKLVVEEMPLIIAELEMSTQLTEHLAQLSAAITASPSEVIMVEASGRASSREAAISPTTEMGEALRRALFSYHEPLVRQWFGFVQASHSYSNYIASRIGDAAGDGTAWALGVAAATVNFGCAASLVALCVAMRDKREAVLTRLQVLLIAVVLTSVMSAGSMCVLITHLGNSARDAVLEAERLRTEHNATLTTFRVPSDAARAFAHTGDTLWYNMYFDWTATFESFPASVVEPLDSRNLEGHRSFTDMLVEMRSLEGISFKLAATATSAPPASMLEIQSVTWSFDAEPQASAIRLAHGVEPLRHNTTEFDLASDARILRAMARFAVFSPRYEVLREALSSRISTHYMHLIDREDNTRDARMQVIRQLSISSIVLSAVALCGIVLVLLIASTSLMRMSARASGRGTGTHGGIGTREIKLGLAFGLILLLFTAILIVSVVSARVQFDGGRDMDAITAHEWIISSSLLAVEAWESGLDTQRAAQRKLAHLSEAFQSASHALYFGARNSERFNRALQNEKLTEFLFGENQHLRDDYRCGFESANSIDDASLLAKGASAAMMEWQAHMQALAHVRTLRDAAATDALHSMRSAVMPLLRASAQASAMAEDDLAKHIEFVRNINFVLCGVTALVVLIVVVWILLPHFNEQLEDEGGSRLLLHLIPRVVCTSVPAIAEFLEDEKLLEGKGGDSDASTEIHVVPIVAIDFRGVVLKFNVAAETLFGYTAAEVVGNKINMLMPPKIATMHDKFLANYRRTGVRRIVGYDRQVHARHKEGKFFPIELNVKEFKRENGDVVFIGFVKDIARNLELQAAQELNNVIQGLATVPMIAIDSLGTILRFNHAAEDCFLHNAADVVNQNVKLLMPESIAARHDAYLATYLRTGEKHIIDTTRIVTGVKKTGDEFPLEITVKEIKSDLGAMSTYLGFVRDLADELVLDEMNRINEDICDLSPIPIIGIDPFGRVLKYNTAAVATFGFEQSEVLGHNIKMLMPQEIADQHDEYLEKYRITGKRNVIGAERELTARHKSGTDFPISLMVREVKKESVTQGTFIGYIMNLTEERSATHRKAIDDAIMNLMPVPICTITDKGLIKRVNKALLVEFGFRADELTDSNVKVLMPHDIAMQHDKYLEAYKRSPTGRVINKVRRTKAKRKNGIIFPIALSVNVVVDIDGIITFIGFLRNLTEELRLEQSFAVNNTCLEISTTPMIAINHIGTIIAFSSAAEKAWRYKKEAVMGQNVKMLMPEHVAMHHDAYLANYRKTGVKHVIDAVSHQEAVDATGRVFPVEVAIREVKKEGQNSKFVGYIRDTTLDDETRRIIDRNEQIAGLSPLPLIRIDLYGTIIQYNMAAQTDFGFSSDEVIGRNIKMLMPDEIAKFHDQYLAQYRKTKVKNVIGTQRRTRGKRKDGRTFAIELFVSEIEFEGDADKASYVAYLRNVQEEIFLLKANEVSGAIADLSPIPLVAIDDRGTIIKFNKAASNAFGYDTPDDVMGRNIKMLMTPEVAEHHDGYLIAYKKTRQKTIVDSTRRVTAMRANGTTFPIEIMVKEITKLGRDSTYLSYLRDLSMEVSMRTTVQISDMIQQLSASPIVLIDEKGTIKRINPAGVSLFRYSSESDLLEHNIKMLMPQEIADRHDEYLREYARTGRKAVIGNRREVPAQTRDGEIIQVEISVEEVVVEGQAHYIGFILDITQRLLLKLQRDINEVILNNSPVPLIVINPRGIIQMFSPAASALLGFSEEETVGKNVKMLMPEEIANKHDGYLEKYLETGEKHVIGAQRVTVARRKDMAEIPVSLRVQEVTSKVGTEKNYMGFVIDLSDTFAVEMSLRVANAVLDMLPMPIISIDDMGSIREFSIAAEQFFGWEKAEVIGKNVKMLMEDSVAAQHDGFLQRYRETGVKSVIGSNRRVVGKHRDGTNLPIQLHVAEFVINESKLFVGFARDMGREEQLRESASIHQALVDLATVPIIAIDPRGKVLRFSRKAQEQFGYSEEEVLGENVKMLMEEHIAVNHDGYLQRYMRTRQAHIVGKKTETSAKRKDGTVFPVELVVKEIHKAGKESFFVGYARDITEELEHRSHAILCSAVEQLMPDPLIVIDEKGIVQTFTRAASLLWGYSVEEVVGHNVKMLMPDDIAVEHDALLAAYRRTGVKHVVDSSRKVKGKRKDGSLMEVELRVKELQLKDQSFFIGYVRDCTGDVEFLIQTEVGAALIEANPDAIVMIDTKGAILKFNAMAEQLFGFERHQVFRRNVKILMPDAAAMKHDSYLANYLRTKAKRIIDSKRLVTAEKKTGEQFQAEISVREVLGTDGEPTHYIGYVRPK